MCWASVRRWKGYQDVLLVCPKLLHHGVVLGVVMECTWSVYGTSSHINSQLHLLSQISSKCIESYQELMQFPSQWPGGGGVTSTGTHYSLVSIPSLGYAVIEKRTEPLQGVQWYKSHLTPLPMLPRWRWIGVEWSGVEWSGLGDKGGNPTSPFCVPRLSNVNIVIKRHWTQGGEVGWQQLTPTHCKGIMTWSHLTINTQTLGLRIVLCSITS